MNKKSPLVTIVTPSYNQGNFLEDTILSVLNQDYPNIEYFIIDGASTDGSLEIIKKYDSRISWWISEPDNGQSDALMKGFRKASGKYLGWLCSDDMIEPSMISISVHFLETYPKYVLTYGDRTRIDSRGNIIGYSRSYVCPELFRFGLGLPQETVLFRNTLFNQVGGLETNLNMVMDYDLWCNFYRLGPFLYLPAFLGRFRSHESNKSTQYTNELKKQGKAGPLINEFITVYKKHFKLPFSFKIRKLVVIMNVIMRYMVLKVKKYKLRKIEINHIRNC